VRTRRWGNRDEFDYNQENLLTFPQNEFGPALFKADGTKVNEEHDFIVLVNIFYISYGLRANADDRFWKGEFTTDDCLSRNKDIQHPKPFVQGKDLVKWIARRIWYLEWGTERAPAKFSRPTFSQLHDAKEKLIAVRTPGATPKIIYDETGLHFDASTVGFIPWHLLKNIINNSIKKTSKYHHQDPLGDRENREEISRQFLLKYVLAVLNSQYVRDWLKNKRRSKLHIYPDDWKQIPIAPLSFEAQQPFVDKVDAILGEYALHGYPLPPESAQKVKEIEGELDEMVGRLYG